ncbi:hypothetical protein D3C77_549300 [compost metagenome]
MSRPWWVPPALMVCNGSVAARASQLPRRCSRDAVTRRCWLPVLVTVVIGSSAPLAGVALNPPLACSMSAAPIITGFAIISSPRLAAVTVGSGSRGLFTRSAPW